MGYSEQQLAAWSRELRISPEAIVSQPTFVVEEHAHPVGVAQLDTNAQPWAVECLWVHPSAGRCARRLTGYALSMVETAESVVQELAGERMLGAVLDRVRQNWGSYDLLVHHQQGEFHHDVVVRVANGKPHLPGQYLVISTNCNGGVKEILCFDEPVDPSALWHFRCPENPEFSGTLPSLLASARTEHWFDPCELLSANARSELKAEFRERQAGGGWCKKLN